MVGVAQLVELRIVIPVVAGSTPVAHPRNKEENRERDCEEVAVLAGLVTSLPKKVFARVAELVDALDLGSSIERCESSSLSFRTIFF